MTYKAVVFDIDGTLSPVLSWLDFTKALGASVDRHQQIFHDYREEHITYEQSREQLIGLWQSTGRAEHSIMQKIFDAWPLDPVAPELIKSLRERHIQICLITGSFDTYAATVGRRLGVKHWYANTEFIFDEAGQLMSYNYVRDQAAEKLKQFQKFLAASSLTATDCLAVGDGPNDIELFKATGRGIFIEPAFDRDDLAGIRAAAWRRVSSLADVRAIINP